jgi:hypothetical protein
MTAAPLSAAAEQAAQTLAADVCARLEEIPTVNAERDAIRQRVAQLLTHNSKEAS